MSDNLKKFVSEHRQDFDTGEPGKDLLGEIDAQMALKNSARISSKWLLKLKYLGFSASVLIITLYFITHSLHSTSANEPALTKQDSVTHYTEQYASAAQNTTEPQAGETQATTGAGEPASNVSASQNQIAVSRITEQRTPLAHNGLQNTKKDSALTTTPFETNGSDPLQKETAEPEANSTSEKKEAALTKHNAKTKLYIPEDPIETNIYTGTLYEGASFRALMRAYKFPGKISRSAVMGKEDEGYRTTMRITSCSLLEKVPNLKAVWLKGKTDKELTVSIKKRFKNIVLIKPDGRELKPEAISHYYRGLGVISEYKGRYFEMVFKDKVELILFFKGAEKGDKILVDGIIEALVNDQP